MQPLSEGQAKAEKKKEVIPDTGFQAVFLHFWCSKTKDEEEGKEDRVPSDLVLKGSPAPHLWLFLRAAPRRSSSHSVSHSGSAGDDAAEFLFNTLIRKKVMMKVWARATSDVTTWQVAHDTPCIRCMRSERGDCEDEMRVTQLLPFIHDAFLRLICWRRRPDSGLAESGGVDVSGVLLLFFSFSCDFCSALSVWSLLSVSSFMHSISPFFYPWGSFLLTFEDLLLPGPDSSSSRCCFFFFHLPHSWKVMSFFFCLHSLCWLSVWLAVVSFSFSSKILSHSSSISEF